MVLPSSTFYTFGMLKSDAVERGLISEIIEMIEDAGFHIVHQCLYRLAPEQIETLYAEHVGKPYWGDLQASVSRGVVPMILEHSEANAWETFRKLMGHRDVTVANKDTVRGKFGISGEGISPAANLVHGSDSEAAAIREVSWAFEAFDC